MALTKIKTGGIADNAITDAKVADNITAGTAATLATARNINGVSFNGSSAITVTAAAGTLTGNTLASGVTASSLTSVGTIGTGVWQGTAIASAYLDADTAHLSGTQTFSGAKTFTGGLTIDPSGDNYVTMTSGATDANLGFLFKNSSDVQKGYVLFDSDDHVLTLDSADRILFKTNSTERMRIASSGFVGIQTVDNSGDYTPHTISAPLHILQKTASQGYGLVVQGNSNSQGGRIGIGEADSNFSSRANVIDIGFDSSTDFIFSRTGKDMIIGVDNSEIARFDTEGNFGIGSSGSNLNARIVRGFSANKGLVIETQQPAIHMVDTDNTGRYFTMAYEQSAKTVYMHNQSNGPFRFDTNGVERLYLLGDGRMVLKNSSLPQDFGDERGHFCISSTDHGSNNNYAVLQMQGHSNANNVGIGGIYFYDHSSNNALIQAQRQNNSGSGKLSFYTSESSGSVQERMTIYDGGDVQITNGTRSSPCTLTVHNNGSSGWLGGRLVLRSQNDGRRGAGVQMHNDHVGNSWFAGVRYNANFARYSVCYESTGTVTQQTADSDHEVFHITDNGATYNDQNTWGDSSDKRIKHSIVDSNSQWDDIKALKVKNFKKIKHGDDAKSLIGVIAQDLENSGMNGLVDEHPASKSEIKMYKDIKEGDNIKSVKYSILYMKAIKALQEAMERIEALENA